MKRKTVLGIAVALGALTGGALVATLATDFSFPPRTGSVAMPPVSADGESRADATLDASLAAHVEFDGRHFNVYVGKSESPGEHADDVWSVAVPAPDQH